MRNVGGGGEGRWQFWRWQGRRRLRLPDPSEHLAALVRSVRHVWRGEVWGVGGEFVAVAGEGEAALSRPH